MGYLRRLFEGWFDGRFAEAALRAAADVETPVGGFGGETTAVLRVPLGSGHTYGLGFTGEPEQRFRRSWLRHLGLGERVYLVDSAPTALLARPLGLLVFRGISTEPVAALWGMWHPLVDNERVPLFDHEWLAAQAVHNAQAIPAAVPIADVQFSLPPLAGPFRRTRAPLPPSGPFYPPSGSDPMPPESCPPVNAFFSLCFQNPLAPLNDRKRDHLSDSALIVKSAFGSRGYHNRGYTAGAGNVRTFDQMMAKFRQDLAAVPNLCRCPLDKVVIYLSAHGSPGSLQWQVDASGTSSVSLDQFLGALATTPEIVANPQKFVLIIQSCHSGQFFGVTVPGPLAGMGLFTSTPDGLGVSYGGGVGRWVRDALRDPNVRTWEDFLARVMWGWRNSSGTYHPRPRNGWIEGCRATATVTSIDYVGDDLGTAWSLEYLTQLPPTTTPTTLNVGNTTVTGTLYDRLTRPCDTNAFGTYVRLQAKIQFTGGQHVGFQGKTVNQVCKPDTRTNQSFVIDVGGPSGKWAQLTVNFELFTRCAP